MKRISVFLLVLCTFNSFARDSTKVHINPLRNYGMFASIEYSSLRFKYEPFTVDNDGTPGSITISNGISLAGGLFYKKKVANWLIIRPALAASFSTGKLVYDLNKYYPSDYEIHPFTGTFQFHLTIPAGYLRGRTSEPGNVKGLTPVFGPSVYLALDEIPTIHPDVKQFDFHLDAGFGFQWETSKVKSHIDLIYSFSLTNIIGTKEDLYTSPIQSLFRDSFSLRYYFH